MPRGIAELEEAEAAEGEEGAEATEGEPGAEDSDGGSESGTE